MQGSVQNPDHQIRSVVWPHQTSSISQSNTCSGWHKYMWKRLNFPSIQQGRDFRPPHNTEWLQCVVDVTQLKPQFTPWSPRKHRSTLGLCGYKAVLASPVRYCLKSRAIFFIFILLLCRVRSNGILQRESDFGDQRGWWAKFLCSSRHCAHCTANRVSDVWYVEHNGPTWTSFLLAALIEVPKQILSMYLVVFSLRHYYFYF